MNDANSVAHNRPGVTSKALIEWCVTRTGKLCIHGSLPRYSNERLGRHKSTQAVHSTVRAYNCQLDHVVQIPQLSSCWTMVPASPAQAPLGRHPRQPSSSLLMAAKQQHQTAEAAHRARPAAHGRERFAGAAHELPDPWLEASASCSGRFLQQVAGLQLAATMSAAVAAMWHQVAVLQCR